MSIWRKKKWFPNSASKIMITWSFLGFFRHSVRTWPSVNSLLSNKSTVIEHQWINEMQGWFEIRSQLTPSELKVRQSIAVQSGSFLTLAQMLRNLDPKEIFLTAYLKLASFAKVEHTSKNKVNSRHFGTYFFSQRNFLQRLRNEEKKKSARKWINMVKKCLLFRSKR